MKLSIKRNKSAFIGIACGVLCALCVGAYVTQVDAQAEAAQAEILARYGGDQIEVCVAKRDIAAGQTITDSDIEQKLWIATMLPVDAVTVKSDAIGQQVGSSILAGEVISKIRFGFDSASIDVPAGMVALSVPANPVQTVGGALSPGMSVDVYAVGGSSTSRIASGVGVIETCANSGNSGSNAWVTLALPPDKVAEMVSAAENLELHFALPSEVGMEELSADVSGQVDEDDFAELVANDSQNADIADAAGNVAGGVQEAV